MQLITGIVYIIDLSQFMTKDHFEEYLQRVSQIAESLSHMDNMQHVSTFIWFFFERIMASHLSYALFMAFSKSQ